MTEEDIKKIAKEDADSNQPPSDQENPSISERLIVEACKEKINSILKEFHQKMETKYFKLLWKIQRIESDPLFRSYHEIRDDYLSVPKLPFLLLILTFVADIALLRSVFELMHVTDLETFLIAVGFSALLFLLGYIKQVKWWSKLIAVFPIASAAWLRYMYFAQSEGESIAEVGSVLFGLVSVSIFYVSSLMKEELQRVFILGKKFLIGFLKFRKWEKLNDKFSDVHAKLKAEFNSMQEQVKEETSRYRRMLEEYRRENVNQRADGVIPPCFSIPADELIIEHEITFKNFEEFISEFEAGLIKNKGGMVI